MLKHTFINESIDDFNLKAKGSELKLTETTQFVCLRTLNVFTALKGTHFYILFVVTAAGVVSCSSPKMRPRTSSIVQFIFYFWSFDISRNILRNQNIS